jgi:hypothetical protein
MPTLSNPPPHQTPFNTLTIQPSPSTPKILNAVLEMPLHPLLPQLRVSDMEEMVVEYGMQNLRRGRGN